MASALKESLGRTRAAQKQGIECSTYLRMLNDQAKA
jgi:hypothetical protein